MKNLLLLTGFSAFCFVALAEIPQPKVMDNALISAISPNGEYAVAQGSASLRIFNLATGEEYTQTGEQGYGEYYSGDGSCVSNNGIVVASTPVNAYPQYWKDGEWHRLRIPTD
ncbi:MAG: hypothetical protein K2H85_00320, partial [Allobaculum sp.]|nr:hypothetical protein [Allobaculum sp.]